MIVYQRHWVRVAELHFDEPCPTLPAVDVVRHFNFSRPRPGTRSYEFHTIQSDLGRDPDWLLGRMRKSTRNEVRQAERRQLVRYEFRWNPDPGWMEEFFDFYDRFAGGKGIAPVNRGRLEAMRRAGALDLSRVLRPDGGVMVWHAHLVVGGRARGLHSASFRTRDHERTLVAQANRYHHWRDMMRFRDGGCAIYDFGGWYAGTTDAAKLSVNRFKESFGGEVVRVFDTEDGVTVKGKVAVAARWAMEKLSGG